MAVTTSPAVVDPARLGSPRWMHSKRLDLALMLCWVPFAVLAAAVVATGGDVALVASGVLLLSLVHQPVTIAMVYGDRAQFDQRRWLYVLSPIVLGVAIYVGVHINILLVALIGAAWNTEHTLMQRYGITRIYRRKGGDGSPGSLDRHLLISWLLVAVAWVGRSPKTSARVDALALEGLNERSAEFLVDARPYASVMLQVVGLYAVVVAGLWLHREWTRRFDANRAVYLYLGATAALFVVIMVHPVVGFLAWVASHAVEYFIIVTTNLDKRYADGTAAMAKLVHSPLRAFGTVVVVTIAILGGVHLLSYVLSPLVYAVAFFSVGALHIFYDGFIWKLRQPTVAKSFSLESR